MVRITRDVKKRNSEPPAGGKPRPGGSCYRTGDAARYILATIASPNPEQLTSFTSFRPSAFMSRARS